MLAAGDGLAGGFFVVAALGEGMKQGGVGEGLVGVGVRACSKPASVAYSGKPWFVSDSVARLKALIIVEFAIYGDNLGTQISQPFCLLCNF